MEAHRQAAARASPRPTSCSPSPQMLRKKGVVGKFVEFFGAGVSSDGRSPTAPRSPTWRPSTARRWASSPSTTRRSATCAAPAAPRPRSTWSSATAKSKACSAPMTRPMPIFTERVELDLDTVEPCLAGPKRPQDRVALEHEASLRARRFAGARSRSRGFGARPPTDLARKTATRRTMDGKRSRSSTAPSSSPRSPAAPTPAIPRDGRRRPAGQEGRREGPQSPPHVKTSLAPGSRVVTDYFDAGRPRCTYLEQARLLHRRLRLHDLHRQQRPAARADRRRRQRRTTSSSPACSPATATSKAASTRS